MSDKAAEQEVVPCRCGKAPEENTSLRGYRYSLSCKCGGEVINFVTRSDNPRTIRDNWRSLIRKEPYKHYVYHLPDPEVDVPFRPSPLEYHDSCPLRNYIRATGGHCSGGGGPC